MRPTPRAFPAPTTALRTSLQKSSARPSASFFPSSAALWRRSSPSYTPNPRCRRMRKAPQNKAARFQIWKTLSRSNYTTNPGSWNMSNAQVTWRAIRRLTEIPLSIQKLASLATALTACSRSTRRKCTLLRSKTITCCSTFCPIKRARRCSQWLTWSRSADDLSLICCIVLSAQKSLRQA